MKVEIIPAPKLKKGHPYENQLPRNLYLLLHPTRVR
jgi:hypothetical protein